MPSSDPKKPMQSAKKTGKKPDPLEGNALGAQLLRDLGLLRNRNRQGRAAYQNGEAWKDWDDVSGPDEE